MNLRPELYQRLVAAKVYIDENFEKPIDLEQISRQAYLSRFHFHRLFRKVYNRTPQQYLKTKRIEKAKKLLSDNRPVAEVCNEVGFESISSFSVLFKKEIGFAPQYYRNMAWLKKQEMLAEPRKVIPSCFFDQYRLNQP